MQLEDLPYELVLKILHYLPIADLKNFSSTSKSCFKLAEDPRLWNTATLHVKNNSPKVLTSIQNPRFKLIQSIPFKTNHSHSLRLQQITISEAGITKNQLLELLSAIDRKNGTSITSISLETSVHLLPRSKETLIVGLTKILFGLSARLCSLCATNESLNSLKVKQTCTVHTTNSSLTFSYRANNGLVPCLDIFSALLNIKGKLDSLDLSVAGVETNAILIRAQDQYEYE